MWPKYGLQDFKLTLVHWGLLLQGQSGWGMNVTTHLHLAPRSRTHGAIPPLPYTSSRHGVSLSTGTALSLPGQQWLLITITTKLVA